jgi:nitrate reductase gamma subunit
MKEGIILGTFIGVILPYASAGLFLIGASFRVITWMRAPRKLNWKLYPVPTGLVGEGGYILEEWMSFKTLFRNNRVVWLGSYTFHLSLFGLAVWFLLFLMGVSVPWLVRLGMIALLVASLYLIVVRLRVPQMRILSSAVEYFNLVLFALISFIGFQLTGEGVGNQARAYFVSLLSFQPIPPPANGMFLLDLLLLECVLVYLPFSKMFHAASKYFAYHKLRWSNPYEAPH